MILSYVIFYCIVTAVLLWAVIAGKGPWYVKATFVPAIIWFSLAMGTSTSSMLGWPAQFEHMPDEFELRWAVVKNPQKKSAYEGEIFLWVTDRNPKTDYSMFDLYRPKQNQPRGFTIPYDPDLHEAISEAMKRIRKGERLMGRRSDIEGLLRGEGGKFGKGRGKGDGKGKGLGPGGGDDGSEDDGGGLFYKLPAPKLPPKNKAPTFPAPKNLPPAPPAPEEDLPPAPKLPS